MNTPQPEGVLPHRHSGLDPESSDGNKGAQSAPLDTGLRRYDVHPYQPFEGICLTDTFQMYEKEDLVDQLLEHNSARRKRQKKLDIRVIMGNPPYSVGQESANDNNQNVEYPELDQKIDDTYALKSSAKLKKSLHDSYIRAIRWASDRIGDSGVIGFVTNAGWVESNSADGMRKCLAEEFSSIYVFHLRGNQRTSGEQSRREGGKIFGSGSRAPIAISLLVKNPAAQRHGQIYFHDIGDYLTRAEKLNKVSRFSNIAGISAEEAWQNIVPNTHGDWLSQRDSGFSNFIAMGDKSEGSAIFCNFSNGIKTNRDAWCYNSSRMGVSSNIGRMIETYNLELNRFAKAHVNLDKKQLALKVETFIDKNPINISWSGDLIQELLKGKHSEFNPNALFPCLYRPFTKRWLYFDRQLNNSVYQMPRMFPDANTRNLVIVVSGAGALNPFTALITNIVADLCVSDIRVSQYFPLYLYDPVVPAQAGTQSMLDWGEAKPLDSRLRGNDGDVRGNNGYVRRDAITDEGLAHFQSAYPGETISKEDVFYCLIA